MANYFYIAVTVKQDRNANIFVPNPTAEPNPGYYAYVVKCSESDNLKSKLDSIGGLLYANIYHTKKRAAEVVNHWNAAYKANGEYLFN